MSGRSSRREVTRPWFALAVAVAVTVAVTACGKRGPAKPEADPAEVQKLAAKMLREVPTPASVRDCSDADLAGGATMTFRTLTELGGQQPGARPEEATWINPEELDVPAARTLVDTKVDKTKRRQAAAELLAAPFWIAYKVDYVNAPMALGVKELKIGTISTRVIRYEKTGLPSCVMIFHFQNDQKISDDAITLSDKAEIDPAVSKILRDDLRLRFIQLAPRGKK